MIKTVKIVTLLLVPIIIILINFLPERDGIFMHPVKRYFFVFWFFFSFTVLPYLASKKYTFELQKNIKVLFIAFVLFLSFIPLAGELFGHYLGGPPRESFMILMPIFLLMVVKQYQYVHYFFFFFILYAEFASLGRAVSGYLFPLNFGFSILIPLLTFYTTYVLSEQLLKMSHKIALSFAFSYAFMVLGAFILDVSYLYTREIDVLWLLKEYGSYDFLLNSSVFIGLVGLFLFFYGVYLMYQEDFKEG